MLRSSAMDLDATISFKPRQSDSIRQYPTVRQSDNPTAADSVRQCPTVNIPLTHTTHLRQSDSVRQRPTASDSPTVRQRPTVSDSPTVLSDRSDSSDNQGSESEGLWTLKNSKNVPFRTTVAPEQQVTAYSTELHYSFRLRFNPFGQVYQGGYQ